MSQITTSLSSNITADALRFAVASVTSLEVGQIGLIDHEFVGPITAISGLVVEVQTRGSEGTAAAIHYATAPVTFGDPADFQSPVAGELVAWPPSAPGYVTLGATTTAIPVPSKDTVYVANSDTTTGYTIADPDVSHNGVRVTVMAGTADAYTLTNTSGFNNGGTASDVATFGGARGDNLVIVAQGGRWNVEDLRNVTLG